MFSFSHKGSQIFLILQCSDDEKVNLFIVFNVKESIFYFYKRWM